LIGFIGSGVARRADNYYDRCIPPWRIHTEAATQAVEKNGKTKVLTMEHAKAIKLNI
jgi:hypothetical protein